MDKLRFFYDGVWGGWDSDSKFTNGQFLIGRTYKKLAKSVSNQLNDNKKTIFLIYVYAMDTLKRFLFSDMDYMYWNYCKTNKEKYGSFYFLF